MTYHTPNQWVLIRGIMSESYHWWDFLSLMSEAFPEDQIHTADMLGNGPHYREHTPLDIHKNIQSLRRQIPTSVDSNPKKILLGFSLGGMLALEWAHHHPEEVAAVVLINSSLNQSPLYKRMTPFSFKEIIKFSLEKDLYQREQKVLRLTTNCLSDEKIADVAQHWGPRGVEFPVKPLNFFRQLFVAARIPQRKNPPGPVLILSSGKDRVVHPHCSEKIAKNWNLPLVRHPDAGHDLTLDAPMWVITQLQEFKNSLKSREPGVKKGINNRRESCDDIIGPQSSNGSRKNIHGPVSSQ